MRNIGFSSGAIAYGDFMSALETLRATPFPCIEMSALRVAELPALVEALPALDLSAYSFISFHASSNYAADKEKWISDLLYTAIPKTWPIVIHPDTIHDFGLWTRFGSRLAVENMDRRKPVGRTACELSEVFVHLPEASLCFDVGHARQCDASMTEAFLILSRFAKKLVQVHISEVNSASQHDAISRGAVLAFQQIAGMIPEAVPVIIESRVAGANIAAEAFRAAQALSPLSAWKKIIVGD